MQLQVKAGIKYRTSAVPELLIMADLLLAAGLARVRGLEPEHARTFDELVPSYRAKKREGPHYDAGDPGALRGSSQP